MTAEQRVTYYSTSTRPLPLEGGDVLTIGGRVTLTGEPYGNAVAYLETGSLVRCPDDEQPGFKKPPAAKTSTVKEG